MDVKKGQMKSGEQEAKLQIQDKRIKTIENEFRGCGIKISNLANDMKEM